MHADIPIDAPGSGVLIMISQDGGFPVPIGGAGQLTAALVHRAVSAGAQIDCQRPVTAIKVKSGRAVAVRTAGGDTVRVRRAVIADTSAPQLYQSLLPADALPASLLRNLEHFVWDTPVLKINYALNATIPWRSASLNDAGTVHLGADQDGLIRWMADLNTQTIPDRPFMLFGQMTTADSSRSPAGTESAWAYTHLPRGMADDESADKLAVAVDRVLEEHAPESPNASSPKSYSAPRTCNAMMQTCILALSTGAPRSCISSGYFGRHPDSAGRKHPSRTCTNVGSAGASPGGGVHGVCGRNAARAALRSVGMTGWPRRGLNRAVLSLTLR